MAKTTYTVDEKAAWVTKFHMSDDGMFTFANKEKENGCPSLVTLRSWVEKASGDFAAHTAKAKSSPLQAEFQASLLPKGDELQKKYIAFLEAKVLKLEAELKAKG